MFESRIAQREEGIPSFFYVTRTREKCSSASELRLEHFCDWIKSKEQNAELPLNANEQDSHVSPKEKRGYPLFFILSKFKI